MIRLRGVASVLLGLVAALALGGCESREQDKLFRYKMTVEVETPQGMRSGASVRELRFRPATKGPSLGQSRPQIKLNGEAVVVDLPDGRSLFALLTGADGDVDYAARIADRTGLWNVKNPWPKDIPIELWPGAPDTEQLKHTSAVPMLVTFRDAGDPISVQRADSGSFETTFGKGIG